MQAETITELERRFARINHLESALGILQWDQDTTMPEGAVTARGAVMGTLSVLRHQLLIEPVVEERLDRAEAHPGSDPWQAANLREMRRAWRHATAVPADLVEANALAVSTCEMTWRAARRDNDFAALLPSLSEVLNLARQVGEAKGDTLGLDPYDALLDGYEPGARAAEIETVFAALADFLPDFTGRVLDHQAARPAPMPLDGPFPVETQRRIGLAMMTALGFDFTRGRLDVSLHPFCGGANDDVRITTRYDEADLLKALNGVLHETGHALYEQNRPRDWLSQPVGASRGMALHESQSKIIELQACRSREFQDYLAPVLREAFGRDGKAWHPENLYRLQTRVARGLIRVDADEVTYPAHIILRFRLERAMIDGTLALRDLPAAWREGMQDLVGVVPPDDSTGCMQDIHWHGGAWGYFPTYTLGDMAAAQLFDAAVRADAEIPRAITRGAFEPLVSWLRTNVHGKGSLLSSRDLLIEATGRSLDSGVFKAHLERRYLAEGQ